jgi:oxaloacetate decarboxylase gamma subunit
MDMVAVSESLKFMVLGMGVVFVFLTILVQVMKLQAHLINKYFPEAPPPSSQSAPEVDDKARTAAIIAAIAEFNTHKSSR